MTVKATTTAVHLPPLTPAASAIKTATSGALACQGDSLIRLIAQYAQEAFIKADHSLPIVMVFERHWDLIPKLLLKNLLPALAKQGYGNFCIEAPSASTTDEIVEGINSVIKCDTELLHQTEQMLKKNQVSVAQNLSDMSFGKLADLLMWCVSSKKYIELAQKIKHLPAQRIMKDILSIARKESISLKGVDVDEKTYCSMISHELQFSERSANLRANEDLRIATMVANLLKLREEQEEGIIFSCGAMHAPELLEEFKKRNLHESIVCYFPQSSEKFDEMEDALTSTEKDLKRTAETLRSCTTILKEAQVVPFCQNIVGKIARDIRDKYIGEIEGNSHTRYLSTLFNVSFRAFIRLGHYVDAILIIQDLPNLQEIRDYFVRVGVETHEMASGGNTYLVVPRVNTLEIAYKIRK